MPRRAQLFLRFVGPASGKGCRPSSTSSLTSSRPSVENLVKKFGEVIAVDDVSFDVAAGEIFAFLGPNGAGKTTTIKMMTGLLRPTSGSVEVGGVDVWKHPL